MDTKYYYENFLFSNKNSGDKVFLNDSNTYDYLFFSPHLYISMVSILLLNYYSNFPTVNIKISNLV